MNPLLRHAAELLRDAGRPIEAAAVQWVDQALIDTADMANRALGLAEAIGHESRKNAQLIEDTHPAVYAKMFRLQRARNEELRLALGAIEHLAEKALTGDQDAAAMTQALRDVLRVTGEATRL